MPEFEPLLVTRDGVGPFRINRFRIYFRPLTREQVQRGQGYTGNLQDLAHRLAIEFREDFPGFFNPNLAEVSFQSKRWNSKRTLRFHLTAQILGIDNMVADYLAPDVHADWVGFHHFHPRGMTVQTLKRNFTTGLDWQMLGVSGAGGAATAGGITALIAPYLAPTAALVGGVGAGATAFWINKYHFLAGRRSWVFGTKQEFGRHRVENYDAIPDDAIAFETAAIERLSGRLFQAAGALRVLGSFDAQIHHVWTRLMRNYIARKGFQVVNGRVWGNQDGYVSHVEPPATTTLEACRGSGECGDLRRLHKKMLPEPGDS